MFIANTRSRSRRKDALESDSALQVLVQVSPKTKRWRNQCALDLRNTIKEKAVKELLQIRECTGGKSTSGDIKAIVKKYNDNGFSYVTKGVINYMLIKKKNNNIIQSTNIINQSNNVPMESIVVTRISGSLVSDVTFPTPDDENLPAAHTSSIENVADGANSTSNSGSGTASKSAGGRPKGVRGCDKERIIELTKEATTKAATLCADEKAAAES